MELLFVAIIAASIGTAVHFLSRNRSANGVALVPAVSTVVAATLWVGLTWLGWPWDGAWIWVVSLVIATLVAAVTSATLSRARITADQHELRSALI